MDAPFPIGDQCCGIMKKKPANQYAKEHHSFPMLATMAEESALRKKVWIQNGCNMFGASHPKSTPMAFWTEQDVLRYIRMMDIPIASVYGQIVECADGTLKTTGLDRSGCMFCCFGIQRERHPNRFQQMFYTHPQQWDYCINKMGIGDVLTFLGVPFRPSDEHEYQAEFDFGGES